jgi:ribonuclease Z
MKTLPHLLAASLLVLGLLAGGAARAEDEFRVTLLGTGSPIPRPDRFGPSTLIEVGGQKLIIDAGRGVPIRLGQKNVALGKIDILFLTHYHSDHTSGIPDLWLTGWLLAPWGRRTTPFHVVGPTGAKALMENLEKHTPSISRSGSKMRSCRPKASR